MGYLPLVTLSSEAKQRIVALQCRLALIRVVDLVKITVHLSYCSRRKRRAIGSHIVSPFLQLHMACNQGSQASTEVSFSGHADFSTEYDAISSGVTPLYLSSAALHRTVRQIFVDEDRPIAGVNHWILTRKAANSNTQLSPRRASSPCML